VNEVLSAPALPLLADLRYLQLLLCAGMEKEITALVKSRRSRRERQNDLEKPYHPIVLRIYQVSSCRQHYYGAISPLLLAKHLSTVIKIHWCVDKVMLGAY